MPKDFFKIPLVVIILMMLPQCGLLTDNKDQGSGTHAVVPQSSPSATASNAVDSEVLLTINGMPRITVRDFEDYLKTVLEAQPQLKQLLAMMPGAEYELFNNRAREEAIQEYIVRNGIDKTPNYQRDLKIIIDFGERQLAYKHFQDAHPVTVTAVEVRKYYDDNKKSIPDLALSRGGINAQGAEFATAAEADAFVAKLQDPAVNFEKAAKEAKGIFKEFKQVNDQSFDVETPLREKIVGMKKVPSVETFAIGGKTWVIKAVTKNEPEYVPFEQIKDRIEAFIKQNKLNDLLIAEIEKLKTEYKFVENKEYFDKKNKVKEQELAKAFEEGKKEKAPVSPQPKEKKNTIPAPVKKA